jgi:alpha-amylase
MTASPLLFGFGLHNHQPIGNFDFIFEEAYSRAYLPFLETFEPFGSLKITQHYTGILLDWFERRHPEYIERLKPLVASGRIELMGGGYYEPILAMLPRADSEGQIRALSERIESLFGKPPRGAWIAERVWEPGLASLLADCGIEYAVLDDAHFKMAGLRPEQLTGPFVTEDQGRMLKVFPISQKLRYLIPFHPVRETIESLRELAHGEDGRVVIMADDGEKFGIWPFTHQSVYEKGWLRELFTALEAESDWLETVTFEEALGRCPARGLVYLPTASYSEMLDWALPWDEGRAIQDFRKRLPEEELLASGRFIKGGFWRFFFSKYRESQHMHRKMLSASEKVQALPPRSKQRQKALSHLWAAQCNCGYWHGVFGGVYLNHIRSEIFHHLIQAEQCASAADVKSGPPRKILVNSKPYAACRWDFFRDGGDALELTVPTAQLLFDLAHGAALVEWDHLGIARNLMNTMTRRPEAYHREILTHAATETTDSETASIHDLKLVKESGLERFLIYDRERRTGNIFRFFASQADLGDFMADPSLDQGDFPSSPFNGTASLMKSGIKVRLTGKGSAASAGARLPMEIVQTWTYGERHQEWRVLTQLTNLGAQAWRGLFGLEFGWSMNAGNTFDRYYRINGEAPADPNLGSRGDVEGVTHLALVEDWWGIRVEFQFSEPVRLWRFPIETVSSSEGGFERTYQSSVVIPLWNLEAEPGQPLQVEFRLRVPQRENEG